MSFLNVLDNAGVQVAIMPFIGGGVYLNMLSLEEKTHARGLIHQALKEVLKEQGQYFRNLQSVVYTLVDENDYEKACKQFANYNGIPLFIVNSEIVNTAHSLSQDSWKIGIGNAGSDRTIGGNIRDYEASTVEEFFYQVSTLRVQALDKNPEGVGLALRLATSIDTLCNEGCRLQI